jgi:very-short-patch-repair endonuclease
MQARLSRSVRQRQQSLLADRARQNRFQPTDEEATLWRSLRAGQLDVAFRRQAPIGGRRIADFLAPAANLIVEVDGLYHSRRRAADRRRDEWLARRGYRVLRLDAELVRRDLPEALRRIREALASAAPLPQ